jgi:hypothetical protein
MTGGEGFSGRSDSGLEMTRPHDLTVFVPTTAGLDPTFHTSSRCSGVPSDRTALTRSAARRAGLTKCRRCFERRVARLKREYATA